MDAFKNLLVKNGETVPAKQIAVAVTASGLRYDDGATQVFEIGGTTTYVEHGNETHGEWYVADNGRFCSFWPPTYRACYDLLWTVENATIVGLEFIDRNHGSRFTGRYI